jgi:hypothetical protein
VVVLVVKLPTLKTVFSARAGAGASKAIAPARAIRSCPRHLLRLCCRTTNKYSAKLGHP